MRDPLNLGNYGDPGTFLPIPTVRPEILKELNRLWEHINKLEAEVETLKSLTYDTGK